METQNNSQLLTPIQAAEYLGVSKDTLSVWRSIGRYNLEFVKVGRLVKYRKESLDAFINRRTHGNGCCTL